RFSRDWSSDVCSSDLYSGNGFSVSVYDDTEIYNNVFVLGDQGAASPQPAAWITQWSTIKAGASLLIANNTIIEPEHDGLRFNAKIGRASCRERAQRTQ